MRALWPHGWGLGMQAAERWHGRGLRPGHPSRPGGMYGVFVNLNERKGA